jgi:hypothetical protein
MSAASKTISRLIYGPSYNPYEGLVLLPFNGHGWASTGLAFQQVIERIKPKLIVEVGVWFGGSVRHMTQLAKIHNPDVEVVGIDTFLGSVEHWTGQSYLMTLKNGRPNIYEQFMSNNVHQGLWENITPFPVDSINGYEFFKHHKIQPDLIYIDAGHDYASVKADLERWTELLPSGGTLLGDDFHHEPIIQAVNDFFGPGTFETINEKYVWTKK